MFDLVKLAEMPRAAGVVEDRYETRPLAEEWAYGCLGAALAEYESEQHAGPQMRAAEPPLTCDDPSARRSSHRETSKGATRDG